jgi:hypothetical protein
LSRERFVASESGWRWTLEAELDWGVERDGSRRGRVLGKYDDTLRVVSSLGVLDFDGAPQRLLKHGPLLAAIGAALAP